VNILDTDALSHLMAMSPIGAAIEAQMKASPDPEYWITSISAGGRSDSFIQTLEKEA
jgi:hypothetical protein